MAFVLSGVVAGPSGFLNDAQVDAWLASRFTSPPSAGTTHPSGSADAGPILTGTNFGGPGQWQLTVPSANAYYVRVTYPVGATNAQSYWAYDDTLVLSQGAVGATGPQGPAGVVAATSPIAYDSGTQTVSLAQSGASSGQFLQWNGTAWAPASVSTGVASVTAANSTITIGGTSSNPTVAVGTVPYSSVSGTPSSLPPNGTAGGDLTGTYPNPTLAAAGTAGTYGSATAVPVITTDSKGRVTSVTTAAPSDTTKLPLAGGTLTGALNGTSATFTGELTGSDIVPSGITGATTATRYVGGTVNSAPTSGTFAKGDFVIDQSGTIWVCTTAGTPGTWTTTISSHLSLRTASATVTRNETTVFSGSTASQTLTAPANPIDGSTWTVLNKSSVSVTLSFTPSMIPLASGTGVTTYAVDAGGAYSFVNYNGSQWYMVATNGADHLVDYSSVALSAWGAASANVAMGSNKITGLANGTASTDAATFGQIPTSLPPNGSAGGDLTGSYPNPTLAAVGTAGTYGSASLVPVITTDSKGRVTSVTTSAPLDATKLPLTGGTMSGAIAMGASKITGLANGTASTDAAAFGQIPTALPPNGTAGGDLTGTYPNPKVDGLQGNAVSATAPTTNQVLQWNGSAWTPATISSGSGINPNYIINGGFDFWQRATSATMSGASFAYSTADRYVLVDGTGTSSSSQVALTTATMPTANTPYAISLAYAGAVGSPQIAQALEQEVVIGLQGQQVTFSCYVLGSAIIPSNTLTASYGTGTSGDVGSYNGTVITTSTFSTATSWTRQSITFTVPSTATGLSVALNVGGLLSGRSVQTTGWKLELGSTPTQFVRSSPTISGELSACQRFYCVLPYGGAGAAMVGTAMGTAASTTGLQLPITYPVPMRSATVTPTVTSMQTVNGATTVAISSVSSQLTNSTHQGGTVLVLTTASNVATGAFYMIKQSASGGKFTFSAEL